MKPDQALRSSPKERDTTRRVARQEIFPREAGPSGHATRRAVGCALLLALPLTMIAMETWVREDPKAGDFALASPGHVAAICVSPGDATVVTIAARAVAADIEQVTGLRPLLRSEAADLGGAVVFAGTLGQSAVIDGLVATGKLDVSALRGRWETFLIATVPDPVPGVALGLVVAGSDRRGTAFGLFELSQAIGVSPWSWWADVTPVHRASLHVAAGTRLFGPPSVRYRGIFLNDEDWGLQPWAAKTFAPEDGGIGPKTYAKVFELLLRLKANTLWPAMHACTRPFNDFPGDAALADDYAIVMGSSHAEPMLRNNVGEWKAPPADYNYLTNRDGVRRYWDERVAANGRYENIYTLGMRGIHDSAMVGPRSDAERRATLETIFADQRDLLARHVNPCVAEVPQMFCAYKEVLDIYRRGLKVPDDATIVWPDDNFGYIRNFPLAADRNRTGGFGVYYHVSYLGHPLSYLWLCTTPPALIWEEMSKAYDLGARRLWILNVGDLKPAEIDTDFFLQMAWDINRWHRENLPDYLVAWAVREFGAPHAREIAGIMERYYRLNFQRKPEHLQWWLPGEQPRPSGWSDAKIEARLRAFATLTAQVAAVAAALPADKQDAFYELVRYPVRGSALANERYFLGERAALHQDPEAAAQAREADGQLKEETRHYNEQVAGGKWRHIMAQEPADDEWRTMRLAPWVIRDLKGVTAAANARDVIVLLANQFASRADRAGAAWQTVPGLGLSGAAVAVFPTTAPTVPLAQAAAAAPRLDYAVSVPSAGSWRLEVHLLPVHPLVPAWGLRLAVALDNGPAQLVELPDEDSGPIWSQAVLNEERIATVKLSIPDAGAHTLRVYGLEPGVVLDRLVLASEPSPQP